MKLEAWRVRQTLGTPRAGSKSPKRSWALHALPCVFVQLFLLASSSSQFWSSSTSSSVCSQISDKTAPLFAKMALIEVSCVLWIDICPVLTPHLICQVIANDRLGRKGSSR